jgi:hypothetical protein
MNSSGGCAWLSGLNPLKSGSPNDLMSEQAQVRLRERGRMLKRGTQKMKGSLEKNKKKSGKPMRGKIKTRACATRGKSEQNLVGEPDSEIHKRARAPPPAHGEVAADAVDGLPLHYRLGLAQRQQHSTLKGVSSWHIGACTHKNETKQKVIRISTVCRLRGNLPSASAAQ